MARYIATIEGSDKVIIAHKATRKGQQTIFYAEDGEEIVAQLPSSIPFYKAGE
jgi:hypothetical protein